MTYLNVKEPVSGRSFVSDPTLLDMAFDEEELVIDADFFEACGLLYGAPKPPYNFNS